MPLSRNTRPTKSCWPSWRKAASNQPPVSAGISSGAVSALGRANQRFDRTPKPILGIRNQGGLTLELPGETGRTLTVQSKTNLNSAWRDWNLTGSGSVQVLPLNELTNQSPRYFRVFSE